MSTELERTRLQLDRVTKLIGRLLVRQARIKARYVELLSQKRGFARIQSWLREDPQPEPPSGVDRR